MLELEQVTAGYGSMMVLVGVSLSVEEGEIVALLGANGAGKTTTLRVISGLLPLRSGAVRFQGRRLDGRPPEEIVAAGVVQVPEGRQVFADLTVAENLRVGAYRRRSADVRDDVERVLTLFPALRARYSVPAGLLSGGEQQMLAIGRALMARPTLLLLDEPSLGLAPKVVRQVFTVIGDINAQGTTIVLVEQNVSLALGLARRGYVLQTGRVRLSGPASELRGNPEVRRLYLGR